MKKAILLSILSAWLAAGAARAQISYTAAGTTVSENFDSLDSGGGAIDVAWSSGSTLPGWFLYRQPAPGTSLATYRSDDGGATTSLFYSYGSDGVAERALGGLGGGSAYFGTPASGAVAGWITLGLTNATGATIGGFSVGFDGEQWRDSGNASAHTMRFEYGFGASFGGVAGWLAPGGSFDWSSPVTSGAAGAIDGNSAGLVANRGGTIGGVTWSANETLWLRWIETNDSGNDHGLAIDNFTFASAPEPASAGLIALAGLACGFRRRRVLSARG